MNLQRALHGKKLLKKKCILEVFYQTIPKL